MSQAISFQISVPRPHSHLLDVEMTVEGLGEQSELILRMPVWTPGSYKIREYSKHLQDFEVRDGDGRCTVEKFDKASWRIDVGDRDRITVGYKIYGFEISPRYNHVDGSHAFINPVASCMYPEGRLDESVQLKVVAPRSDWRAFCGLESVDDDGYCYEADDFDELYDSPVEVGPHQWFDFEVDGVPHRFVVWSDEDIDLAALKRDVPGIVRQNAEMFGEIPYDRYVFLNHAVRGKWGGLEHRHSSVNIFGPENFDDTDPDDDGELGEKYANVLRLLSHEHFHAYHVKRLRPEELMSFDYQRENYTHSLWAIEGVTSYFDTLQLRRCDLIGAGRYIDLLEDRIGRLHRTPGRLVQSLEESSFDAWIKLYRRDENTPNASVSYYLKGELVVWLIDLWIRDQTDGAATMTDVIREMYDRYYNEQQRGFPRDGVQQVVTEIAGADASSIFETLVESAEPIEWEEFLEPVGLQLEEESEESTAWLGIRTGDDSGGEPEVKFVQRDSPAEDAGIYVGDRLVAIDGRSTTDVDSDELLADVEPGQTISIHLMRRERLRTLEATVSEAPPQEFELNALDDLSDRQHRLLEGWLGATQWDDQ